MSYSIVTADGQDSKGQQLTVKWSGLDLQLQLVAGQELISSSSLALIPVLTGDKTVESESLTAVISSDQGVFSRGQTVSWLIADWGVEHPLNSLHITLTTKDANDKPIVKPDCKGRIKIFTNGHWLPLTPLDILAVDSKQQFAPVMAGKVMIELVQAGEYGLWKPLSVAVDKLELSTSTAPGDIELNLVGQSVSFKQVGLLSGTGFLLEDFAPAINSYLQQNPDALSVPLHLSAKNAGKLTIDFKPVTQNLLQQLPDQVDGKLNLGWQDNVSPASASAKTSITLSENQKLQELSFLFDYNPVAEHLYFSQAIAVSSKAQFANERSQIAQGFQTSVDGINLTGFDIKLEKRSDHLTASLAIYPDQNGYPADQPYGGALLTIDDNSQWQNGWLSLTFPKPVHLSDSKWWLVLSIQQGEVFWWFADNVPEPAGAALYRIDQGSWLACTEKLWLQTRVRVLATDTKSLSSVVIQRGTASESLTIRQGTNFKVEPAVLKRLNSTKQVPQLSIEFIAQAPGTLTLNKLRLAYS